MLDELQTRLPKSAFFIVATLWYLAIILAILYAAGSSGPGEFRYGAL